MKLKTSQCDLPFNGHPNGHHDDGAANRFGCSVEELSELLELDNEKAACTIREQYGGIREICRRLKTSPTKGLSGSTADLQIRTQTFGSNASRSLHASQNFLPLLWKASWDITLGILMATVAVAFALSFIPKEISTDIETESTESTLEWIQYIVLFAMILLLVLAIALIESFKQQWICAAGTAQVRKCTVLRHGEYVEIPANNVVVGDICDISYGNIVPASGFLIHGHGVRMKENLPDGTVQIVAKDGLTNPVVHSGSHVVGGSGQVVITKVGQNAELLKKLCVSVNLRNQKASTRVHDSVHSGLPRPKLSFLEEEHLKRKSVLEAKVRWLTVRLCYAGIAGTVLLFGVLIVQLSLKKFTGGQETSIVDFIHDFMRCLVLTAAVVVVVVPLRLPAGIVLVFAQALKKMLQEGNVVRHIGALESIGYVTDIVTSKTGVITKSQMSVVQIFLGGHVYKGLTAYQNIPAGIGSLLVRHISLSTEYRAQVELSQEGSCKQREQGDPRDFALLKFVGDLHHSYRAVRELMLYHRFAYISPFDSSRKFNIKVIPHDLGGYQLLTKGSAEVVLSRCCWILDADGNVCPFMRSDFEAVVKNVLQPMSTAGLSTICLAFKNYVPEVRKENEGSSSPEPDWKDEESVMSDLTCVAIFGVEDPIRDELPESVKKCCKFGIAVHLVTGEGVCAAESVAVKCGIVRDHDKSDVVDAHAFEAQIRLVPFGPIVPEYFSSAWPKLGVVARASPESRYTIVRVVSEFLSKTQYQVIACVGKDMADVPSLRLADVGFSMGTVGSDVTREASDIILQHNSFLGIVGCIVWSRCIQENVRKLVQFQLTSVAVTYFAVMVGVCVLKESPLNAMHLLWIKIILDLLASVAFSSEQPVETIDCRPYTKSDSLFSRSVGKFVILHFLYQIVVVLVLFFAGESFIDMERDHELLLKTSSKYTTIFNTCILMMLFNEINARALNGERNVFYQIHCNCAFAAAWIGCVIVQILIVQFGGSVFSTTALTLEQWGWCLFFGVGQLLWCQIIAFLPNCGICEKSQQHGSDFLEMEQNSKALWEVEEAADSFDDSHLGMILWKHGLTRLQNQLRVAHAFKNILDNSSEPQSSQDSLSDLNFSSLAYGFPKHLQSFSTHNCYYPQLHPSVQPETSQMPSFKSKSADDVLFDPWNVTPPGSFSNQLYVPRSSGIRHDPCKNFFR